MTLFDELTDGDTTEVLASGPPGPLVRVRLLVAYDGTDFAGIAPSPGVKTVGGTLAASIERVLLFSYPAMVLLINAILRRQAPQRRVVWAMLVTYVGIYFAMGGIDLHELRANAFGAGLVLIAALTTATYFLIGERYVHVLGSTRFAAVAMSSSSCSRPAVAWPSESTTIVSGPSSRSRPVSGLPTRASAASSAR